MNVLFVVMPFATIRPHLGVSLLKAHLTRRGVQSRALYLTMHFAKRIGSDLYNIIGEQLPAQSLVGEWVFREALYGADDAADENYLAEYAEYVPNADPPLVRRLDLEFCRSLAEPFLEECLHSINWGCYDVVGFTSTFAQHVPCLALAKLVKWKCPTVQIVFGGANCEEAMGLQTHRSFPFVDFVCSGESDLSFVQLIEALERGHSVDAIGGIVWREEGASRFASLSPPLVSNLDTLPIPDFSDYFEQLRDHDLKPTGARDLPMETSRGCWWGQKHHCTFCGLNGASMAFRRKSAVRVLEEIALLEEKYHEHHIAMVDNILGMDYFRDLLPTLRERKSKVALFYETKANLTKTQLTSLKQAGVIAIQPGIESFSSKTLRLMRKGVTGIQNIQLLKWCKELEIIPHWNLLYGFPGEDPAEYDTTTHLIEALHHLQPPHGMSRVRLDRFSPYFFDSRKLGLTRVRPVRSYALIYDLPALELFELAYYFDFEYEDGRDPESYVGAVKEAVARWRADYADMTLTYVDHGEFLALWDFRTTAARTVTMLTARDRALYLYCDRHRSFQQLLTLPEFHNDAAALVARLDDWIESKTMLRLDDQYLALAVNGGTTSVTGGGSRVCARFADDVPASAPGGRTAS